MQIKGLEKVVSAVRRDKNSVLLELLNVLKMSNCKQHIFFHFPKERTSEMWQVCAIRHLRPPRVCNLNRCTKPVSTIIYLHRKIKIKLIQTHCTKPRQTFNCCFTVHFDKYKTVLPTNAPFIKT